MKFLEEQDNFYHESDEVLCTCSECKEEFVLLEEEDANECPLCGAKFDHSIED